MILLNDCFYGDNRLPNNWYEYHCREPLSVASGEESVKVGLIKYINVTSTGIVLSKPKFYSNQANGTKVLIDFDVVHRNL